MKRLPMMLTCGPLTLTISLVGEDRLGNGSNAQYESSLALIKVFRGSPAQVQAENIIHEFGHAHWDQWFDQEGDRDQEVDVKWFCAAFWELILRNWQEVSMLKEAVEKPEQPNLIDGVWAEIEP